MMRNKMGGSDSFTAAIEYANKELPDAAAVLITTVATESGTTLSTTTEAIKSLEEAEAMLNTAENYARIVLERQKAVLEPHASFAFTIVEYLPLSKQLHRKVEGIVETKWLN